MSSVRRLTAILAADVAGYSRLMGADEEGTHERLKVHRVALVDPNIAEHHGRIVKTTGDGLLVEFPSVVDAVRCAVDVQRGMVEQNAAIPADERIEFRIGINLGDVIAEGGDIFGDGVNIAARLEALAEPGGICVSRVVRDQVRDKLDFSFEDMGEQQVKNIARPVHVWRIRLGAKPAVSAPLALPDKPSLAVLPFQNMTGDPEQGYFVDGVVEEITTAISRLPWLFVIARNSSFTYKGRAVDVKQVARELGVRYVLEGSVRKGGDKVRITGQLIDTASGAHIWSDRFDGALDDIFELQDQVASSVAGAIEPKLIRAEMERARRKPTNSLGAYDVYLRALAEFHKVTREGYVEAIRLLEAGLELDPAYAPAAALLGYIGMIAVAQGWLPSDEAEKSVQNARQAARIGKDDPETLCMAGVILSTIGAEQDTGASLIDRALMLNPNSAHAWDRKGWAEAMRNNPEVAIEAFHRAMRLSPLDPIGYHFTGGLGLAYFVAERYDDAMAWIDRSLREEARWMPVLRLKVALCGYLDRPADAEEWLSRLLDVHPGLTLKVAEAFLARAFPHAAGSRYLEGLRKAGMPEE
jgi:TolB-like protein/class 3 adenylate cyclase